LHKHRQPPASCTFSTFQYVNTTSRDLVLVFMWRTYDGLCGPVVRVPGYRYRGPGSIPGATRFSEK
jgi:hypothetical protein